jgi:hypothetical protein
MKKIMRSFMAMALGLSLVLSGCSKDDDESGDYAKEIAGNYVGNISLNGLTVATNIEIVIKKVDEKTAELSLNAKLPNLPDIGEITLNNVKCEVAVIKEKDDYALNGKTTVSIPELGNTSFPLEIKDGYIKSGQADIPIIISMGVDIPVVYNGQKQ